MLAMVTRSVVLLGTFLCAGSLLSGCMAALAIPIVGAGVGAGTVGWGMKEIAGPDVRTVDCQCTPESSLKYALAAAEEIKFKITERRPNGFEATHAWIFQEIVVQVADTSSGSQVRLRVKATMNKEKIADDFVAAFEKSAKRQVPSAKAAARSGGPIPAPVTATSAPSITVAAPSASSEPGPRAQSVAQKVVQATGGSLSPADRLCGSDAGKFTRVDTFPEGKQTDVWTSAFLSGFELSNSVEIVCQAPEKQVWIAAKRAAEALQKVGKRKLAAAEEGTGRIQNGKISRDEALGMGVGAWLDEIATELTALGPEQTKVVVSRRVVQTTPRSRAQRGSSERPWVASKSNGQIESWLLTQVEVELASVLARAGGPEKAPSPPEAPKARPAPAGDVEAQLLRLKDLRQKNLISEDEYQAVRKKVLEGLLAPGK